MSATKSKADILAEATEVVGGRGKSYGALEDNFVRIVRLWNAHLVNRYPQVVELVQLDAQDVSMMMALMKIARLANDPNHHDSWVDVAGYAACGGELASLRSAKAPAASSASGPGVFLPTDRHGNIR